MLSLSNSGAVKFGTVEIFYSPLSDAFVAVLLGIVCGLLGAFFVAVYSNMMVFRKKYVTTNFRKILEVLLLSFATSSAFYWFSAYSASIPSNCRPVTPDMDVETFAFTCPPDTYNS